jgi:Ca2+-binding RTX toxin-like protein
MMKRINELNDLPEPQDLTESVFWPLPTRTITGTNGDDILYGSDWPETIYGLDGSDWLVGSYGNDRLFGGAGYDYLVGGQGADVLDGGDGEDWVNYDTSPSSWGVVVDLAAGVGHSGDAEGDTYVGIENVLGSVFNDLLAGTSGNNWLAGGWGNDTLIGRAGNDRLEGGAGDDWLDGGAGADILNGGDSTESDWVTYASASAGITANLATGKGSGGDAQGDIYIGIENVSAATATTASAAAQAPTSWTVALGSTLSTTRIHPPALPPTWPPAW